MNGFDPARNILRHLNWIKTFQVLVIFIWLIFSCFTSAQAAQPNRPNLSFTHILPEQLATLGYITDIDQDFQGYMWFAGTDGLARYNAYELTVFRHSDENTRSISHNSVNAIEVTRDGNIWLATRAGLDLFEPRTAAFKRFAAFDIFNERALQDIHQDKRGRLWVANSQGLFLFDAKLDRVTQYGKKFFSASGVNAKNESKLIWSIAEDHDGKLWLATQKLGVVSFDVEKNEFLMFRNPIADKGARVFNDVRKIYVDSKNTVWAGTYENGLFKYSAEQKKFISVTHNSAEKSFTVWDVAEDKRGNIWVGDGWAVNLMPKGGQEFFNYTNDEAEVFSPGNYVVRKVFEDRAGDIWLGYFPSGVDRIDQQASAFSNYASSSHNSNSITSGGVTAAFEEPDGSLWIGTGYGLNLVNPNTQQVTRFVHDEKNSESLSGSTILSITNDEKNTGLWLGIWSGGLSHYDKKTKIFTNYLPDISKPYSIKGKEVWSVIRDHDNVIWAATELGLNRLDPSTGNFEYFVPPVEMTEGEVSCYSRIIFEDSHNQLWLGSVHGLFQFDRITKKFTQFKHDRLNSKSLSDNFVTTLFEDSRQRLWVGTSSGLNLFDSKSKTFTSYKTADGLPDEVIGSILEDAQGNLWLGTQKGISQFNPDSKYIRNFDKHHGLADNFFGRRSAIKLTTGELLFGHTKGYSIFDPKKLAVNNRAPNAFITDFKIANRSLIPGEENSPLASTIETTQSIELGPKDNVFSIEYAALNFNHPEDNQYAYRLREFENEWNYVGNKRSATYTNMSPGRYLFEVKSSNNDGTWNNTPTSLEIIILPPKWRSLWAYLLYGLIACGFIYWYIQIQKFKFRFQSEKLEQERLLVRRLTQIDKLKDEFLANTSHELRTPLNGIIGLAESLRDGGAGDLSLKVKHHLSLIADSGKRLANLVNDILDFSQLKNKGIKLNKKNLDLHVLADVVLTLSKPLAEKKSVIFVNNIPKDIPPVFADEDRVLQILHNLIGNAVKFTDRGVISVGATLKETAILVEVADTGSGIPPERLTDIFESFTQVDGSETRSQGGAGLGLSVTKQLVELHGGQIQVESVFGIGSTFSFSLPMSYGLVDAMPTVKEPHTFFSDIERKYLSDLDDVAAASTSGSKRILIVDDDSINRKVVANYLSMQGYAVLEAESAETAIEFVEARRDIDLVLLDIMMPRVSGYEACKILRKRHAAHELPIILLTARVQMNDLVLGFDAGANDFLVKPVAREVLLARVATHLQLNDVMRNLDQKVAERTHELHQANLDLVQTQKALERANFKLEVASLSDPLTGLHNRRFLNKSIVSDVAIVDRTYNDWVETRKNLVPMSTAPVDQDLVFMVLDIDFFKQVNDNFGHTAGDRVLEQISLLLLKTLRESDYLIRWGGEEFLIVVRFCSRDQAIDLAERIRQLVDSFQFDLDAKHSIHKTCSIGLAAYPFYKKYPSAITWEQVIDTADRALYMAKEQGRNQWVWIEANEEKSEIINPAAWDDMQLLISQQLIHIKTSKDKSSPI